MAARTIETKAIISAEDKTGNVFASVLQKLSKMDQVAKTARISVGNADRASQTARRAEAAHHREVERVQREIGHHGAVKYATQTMATAVAAHSIVDVIKDSLKAGASYQHEVTALQNAGRNAEEMQEITKAARDAVAQIPTSTYIDNLKVINETTSAFGSLHHAIENLPFMQKSASMLQSAVGDKMHVDAGDLGNKMARVFEERGTAGNPEVFRHEASEAMRAMVFSGGKFNPDEFLNFAQQAKSSLQNYDLPFLSRIVPSLIGTQGGERAGTAANAFSAVITGKARDKKQVAAWEKYGLLDPTMVSDKKDSWTAGAVKNTNLALTNPLRWAEEVALPAMKAHGVNIDDRLELSKALGTMFRNQNGNFFANEIMQAVQRARLHKDSDLIDRAGSFDEIFGRNLWQDPTVSIKALTASLEDLVTTVSAPAMTTVASGLTSMAGGIQSLSNALKDHPLLAMATGGAVAGGALAGSGYMAYQLANGFGLATSATALEGSAAALDAAAIKLGAAGTLTAAEGTADKFLAGGTVANLAQKGGVLGLGALGSAGIGMLGLLAFDTAMINGAPMLFGNKKGARYGGKPGDFEQDPAHPGMHFVPAPRRGSSGRWVKNPPTPPSFAPIGPLSDLPSIAARDRRPQQVDLKFDQPPPQKLDVQVTASSALIQIVDGLKSLSLQLKAHSDTGPGGLGETSTNQH